jgi:nicotinate-nucleotide pyrophosphorylase (carboxylating)
LEPRPQGDITTLATIPAGRHATAVMAVREAGVVCGVAVAEAAFKLIDSSLNFERLTEDGIHVDGKRTPVD